MNSRRDSGDRPLSVPNACDDGCAKCSVPQRSSCRQDFANFHGDTPSPSYQIGCLFAYERLLRARIGRPVENNTASSRERTLRHCLHGDFRRSRNGPSCRHASPADPPRNPHKFRQPDNLSAIVGPIDPTSSDDALAKNVSPGWSRWHLPWRLAAPRRRSFRYELEAPVEAVIEQESSAAVNVKVIPTMRVVHGRPDPTELLA